MKTISILFALLAGVSVAGAASDPLNPNQDKPAELYVASYDSDRKYDENDLTEAYDASAGGILYIADYHNHYRINWANGTDSLAVAWTALNLYRSDEPEIINDGWTQVNYHWGATEWPELAASAVRVLEWESIWGGLPWEEGGSTDVWNWGPEIAYESCAGVNGQIDYADWWALRRGEFFGELSGDIAYERKAQTVMRLRTGGKAGSKKQNLFCLSASAQALRLLNLAELNQEIPVGESYLGLGVTTNLGNIPPAQITVNGKQLGADGKAWLVLPDDADLVVTPKVSGVDYYTFGVEQQKYKLIHLTHCTALTDTNNARTTVGVGEYVSFSFDPVLEMSTPEIPHWETSAGGVSSLTGSANLFTAPSNGVSATVTVHVRDVQLNTTFNVREPSGIDEDRTYKVYEYTNHFGQGVSGAGMYLRVYLAPTTVSFCRLQCKEVGFGPDDREGYYEDPQVFPLPLVQLGHHIGNGADTWFQINEDNSWEYTGLGAGRDWDRAWRGNPIVNNVALRAGKFRWTIPGRWRIDGGDGKHFATWHQNFILDDDGTMTVKKFKKTVTRPPSAP